MCKKLPHIITTAGLLGLLTGSVMLIDTAKPLSFTTELPKPVQTQTSLRQSGFTPIQAMGFGIFLFGLGLSVFGYRQIQKQKRETKTNSITFDFTKGDTKNQTLHEVAVVSFVLGSLFFSACGGAGSKGGIKITDGDNSFTVKENEIVSEDGTKGYKGDSDNTNLQTIYEGLTFDNIYLIDGADKKITSETVALNSKFSIVYEGIKNYTLQNGKAYPKLTMLMTGEDGVIINEDDLLASYTEGLSPDDASVLRATFTVGEPMQPGKDYICYVTVTDKNNNSATIQTTWLFKVK